MARGVNKVILIGNLGADPEVRYTPGGAAVANLTVATTDSWKDKNSGERQDRTEWHRVVLFARLAEIAGEYLKKGSKVYLEGRLQTRKWQDKQGQDRYTTEIVCNELQMLDSRAGEGSFNAGGAAASNPNFKSNASNKPAEPMAQPAGGGADFSDFDDDIPF